jgi:hypothetical protein
MTPRIFVSMAGMWLVVSAFLWPHSDAQMLNVLVVGVSAVVLALVSMRFDWARYVTAAMAAWLILSTFRFATLSRATLWNNAILGAAVFAASLLGGGPEEIRRERELYGRT